jgi:hypothetical protein
MAIIGIRYKKFKYLQNRLYGQAERSARTGFFDRAARGSFVIEKETHGNTGKDQL